MTPAAGRHTPGLHVHVLAILLAALAIALLSAGIRHAESRPGCDHNSCYTDIAQAQAQDNGTVAPDARQASTPMTWAKRAHRALASTLAILVLALVYRTRASGREWPTVRIVPLLMLTLLLALAIIGPMSHLKTRPIIATLNLAGGTALAALSWQLLLVVGDASRCRVAAGLRRMLRFAMLLLVLQIVAGIWVSANFAGLACSGIPGCNALPQAADATPWAALAPLRELQPDALGRVPIDAAAYTIHMLHRIGALLAALALAIVCLRAARTHVPARLWTPIALLLALQCALGLATITSALAMPVTLAHGFVATLLLLAAMRLYHAAQPPATESTQ